MSALGDIITAAVGAFIAEHPKLFADERAAERALKMMPREIVKSLTREPKNDGEQQSAQTNDGGLRQVNSADRRAIAYRNFREAAGALGRVYASGDTIYLPAEADTPRVHAFADMPDKAQWVFVEDRRQLIAWAEFFDAILPGAARKSMTTTRGGVTGALLPWPWPPSKTGKTYDPDADLGLDAGADEHTNESDAA